VGVGFGVVTGLPEGFGDCDVGRSNVLVVDGDVPAWGSALDRFVAPHAYETMRTMIARPTSTTARRRQ